MTNLQKIEYIDAQIRELKMAIAVATDQNRSSLKQNLRKLEKKLNALI